MIVAPKPPSISSYIACCRQNMHSLLRFLQYDVLDGIELPGTVLDLCGTHNTNKHFKKLLKKHEHWVVLNINNTPDFPPDIIADYNIKLPLHDAEFDHVVCFNALEHIYNIDFAVSEIYRVVRKGGKILILIPFLYPLHADSDDYHRPTASWWQDKFEELGASKEYQKIVPLAWCDFSTGFSFMDNYLSPFKRSLLRPFFLFPALFKAYTLGKASIFTRCNRPLGYFIEVIKQ